MWILLFSCLFSTKESGYLISIKGITSFSPSRRQLELFCICLVIIGFVPGYTQIDNGLELVDIKDRYGWQNIETTVEPLGTSDTVFLADRAREFSWFTNRKTAVLVLPEKGLGHPAATESLNSLYQEFSTDYLLMDTYTVAHWNALNRLLSIPMGINHEIPREIRPFLEPQNLDNQISLKSLRLEALTDKSNEGKHIRIFSFQPSEFQRVWHTENLGPEWLAKGDGQIINATRNNQLIIGENETYTNTWRRADDSLNVDINGGFMLIEVEEVNASIPRVTVKNATYEYSAMAERLSDEVYYYPLGDFTVGDIRVVCEGNPGDRVIIKSMSIWQAVY